MNKGGCHSVPFIFSLVSVEMNKSPLKFGSTKYLEDLTLHHYICAR